ncbi:MAG: putative RNA uridine N3 methyltransferase [Candidatus Sigynarchaeota archaeon]
MPTRNSRFLKVFLPADLVRNVTSIEQKTLLLGDLSRYCAIYKVDEINIYDVPENWKEKGFELMLIEDVLNYQMTPQYLRKYRFERRKTLSAVGLLHPLNTPNHPVEKEAIGRLLDNDLVLYRQGIVIKLSGDVAHVDIGLEKPIVVHTNIPLNLGQLVDAKINRTGKKIEAVIIEKKSIPFYWGYSVNIIDAVVPGILKSIEQTDVTIATSKYGRSFGEIIKNRKSGILSERDYVSIFFGPRTKGLIQFFESREDLLASFDFVIDCFPESGTKSIRLEEAIPICLALIDLLFA